MTAKRGDFVGADLDALAATVGFGAAFQVEGRSSIADLFKRERRCGIYLLHFGDGSAYVGQAVDVTRRFVSHTKTWEDIVRLRFMEVARTALDPAEQGAIRSLEAKGVMLRNVAHVSVLVGERDFDLILPSDEQDAWVSNPDRIDWSGPRVSDPALRFRYERRFEQFCRMPFADDVAAVSREYVAAGVPVPRRSEIAFWNCTCLPAIKNRRVTLYARLNIHAQEVFNAHVYDERLWFSWQLALSPLERAFGREFQRALAERWPASHVTNDRYKPGGQDQFNLVAEGAKTAIALLREPAIRMAMRQMNLLLMRKGPALNKGNHCLDLADRLIPADALAVDLPAAGPRSRARRPDTDRLSVPVARSTSGRAHRGGARHRPTGQPPTSPADRDQLAPEIAAAIAALCGSATAAAAVADAVSEGRRAAGRRQRIGHSKNPASVALQAGSTLVLKVAPRSVWLLVGAGAWQQLPEVDKHAIATMRSDVDNTEWVVVAARNFERVYRGLRVAFLGAVARLSMGEHG